VNLLIEKAEGLMVSLFNKEYGYDRCGERFFFMRRLNLKKIFFQTFHRQKLRLKYNAFILFIFGSSSCVLPNLIIYLLVLIVVTKFDHLL